ncbi:MAG: M28 family peptidase [Gemmatimonadetes bacterium]|nr:M28 family peptidase [Gemmatimonadota bacterium]MCB9505991.1 M28 family peptidase [Gemmatimonadales bacterium]MCA9763456.1 M28 family peptidase [Gemmatimonadota bacterium]MCA9767850.1 M28 family peptidase [Gemmatimonadota bacterium]MCB9519164.1 M28 family peptidase [Gemmatimonadales bacterium]
MHARPFGSLLLVLLAACGDGGAAQVVPEFDGARAMARARTQLEFGPRIPGTAGHAAMAAWLDSLTRTVADTVVTQRWQHVTLTGDTIPQVNVIARFNPEATRRVLYLAHWDTRPMADAPESADSTAPVAGANDGASGVSVLLGVMDALAANRPSIGVDLLFVDGEDFGKFEGDYADVLIGSRHYAANMLPPAKPEFAVVWDMVGAAEAQMPREGYGTIAAPAVVDRVWALAGRMGYGHIFVQTSGTSLLDDHKPLIDAGIRAIDVIGWPYPHWHTPEDTFDKLSQETLEAVGNVAVALVREVDRER